MTPALAQSIVLALQLYAAVGLLFALIFVFVGVGKIDPAAPGSSWGFRLMIVPGCVAFWPLLLARWIGRKAPPVERSPHR